MMTAHTLQHGHRAARGFTLIELMIVVAIVAILGALAYPSYTNSLVKGRRAQGRTALAELLQQQERYLTQTNSYCLFTTSSTGTTSVPSTDGCPATVPFKVFSGDNPASPAYYLSTEYCPDSSGANQSIRECVRVVATPVRTDAEVANLKMQSTGVKTCTGTSKDATTLTSPLCWP